MSNKYYTPKSLLYKMIESSRYFCTNKDLISGFGDLLWNYYVKHFVPFHLVKLQLIESITFVANNRISVCGLISNVKWSQNNCVEFAQMSCINKYFHNNWETLDFKFDYPNFVYDIFCLCESYRIPLRKFCYKYEIILGRMREQLN